LYSLSGSLPREQEHFFDTRARVWFDNLSELPGPLPWLSDDDLDAFVTSYSHHGTFAGGLNWYRNIDRNQMLLQPFVGRKIEQPALFIGAEFDCIFGQTEESVLATRAAIPNLRDPLWVSGSGHWIQQEKPGEVNEALLTFLHSVR
jgi:pimeloyl-ACP methyl ester carboxylesterase